MCIECIANINILQHITSQGSDLRSLVWGHHTIHYTLYDSDKLHTYGIVRFREGGGNDIVKSREGAEAKFRGGAEARLRRGAEVYCECFVVSIPSCLTTHEGQEGRDTLMVLTQLGSGNYKTISLHRSAKPHGVIR